MELGCNHPISPLALADVIGLDVLPAVVQTIHDEFADSKYRPKLFILLVRAGRLELPRPLGQQILSLPRLPFRHARPSASRLYARRTTGQPARRLGLNSPPRLLRIGCLAGLELAHGRTSTVAKPSHDRVVLRQRPGDKHRSVDETVRQHV
jgi:hypothetical protein